MFVCRSCQHELPQDCRFCPACGEAVAVNGGDATGPYQAAEELSAHAPSSGPIAAARFTPGQVLANRFRIVNRIGKGGMGEVYRADDLRLGQAVALKFLPRQLTQDRTRLAMFHEEVKLSRQVSHPNVCRVYDIAEHDGQPFLSMEYIDGEDLAGLLKRIGRLPSDKGVQIAQQMCAGLAAAHEKGVIHRDLKPANIMLDGRGQVRITDFGLARLAEKVEGTDAYAGTLAYMAAEQLAGREATARSDLYALGLVLYEVFTGQRAFQGKTVEGLLAQHEQSSVTIPSSIVSDIDPAVERVILHCLEEEPAQRPSSAHGVAAALPDGDPLAAALAAGQTPSPELVAAAGETGTLSLSIGIVCLALVLVGLIAHPFLEFFVALGPGTGLSPSAMAPAQLEFELQKEILGPLGYYDRHSPPDHSVHGLHLQRQPDGSHRMEFWYRQRHRGYLTPAVTHLWQGPVAFDVSMSNPPPFDSGMVSVRVDLTGKLIELLAVPDGDSTQSAGVPDKQLFEWADLESKDFDGSVDPEEWPPHCTPPIYAGEVIVYRPRAGDSPKRVVVARDGGRLVYFYAGTLQDGRLVGRQFVPPSQQSPSGVFWYAADTIFQLAQVVILLASIFLALRNLRLTRVDRQGALRFAVVLGTIQILVWLFGCHHVPDFARAVHLLQEFLYRWMATVFRVWLFYLALEPYVRRLWPDVLIAWTRALDGRFRDALLGRELLIGSLTGVMVASATAGVSAVASLSGAPPYIDSNFDPSSPLRLTATLLLALLRSPTTAIWSLVMLFLCRVLLRDGRLAVAAFTVLYICVPLLAGAPIAHVVNWGILFGGFALMIARFGLLAGTAYWFVYFAQGLFLITPHVTTWYGLGTLVALGSVAAVALYGCYTSTLAQRAMFGTIVSKEA